MFAIKSLIYKNTMENKLKHTKGGVTRPNFSRDFSRNGVALKIDETCYTSQLSQKFVILR